MNTKLRLILLALILFNCKFSIGQNGFDVFNKLPITNEVRAPEFNIRIKYIFKIDTFTNNLIIQNLSRSKDEKIIHFYQRLSEVPLNDLTKGSIKVLRSIQDTSLLEIVIKTKNNKKSINSYWLQVNKVEMINSHDRVTLGSWTYSKKLYQQIEKMIRDITLSLPDSEYSKNQDVLTRSICKYKSGNIVGNIKVADEISIGNGYYYGKSFKNDKSYLYPNLINKLNIALNNNNIYKKYPLPIIVHANKEGKLESIFVGYDSTYKNIDVDISNLENLKPTVINSEYVQTKYIFLLE